MADSYTRAKDKKSNGGNINLSSSSTSKPSVATNPPVDPTLNLNKLGDVELKAAKAKMDVAFNANQKKPGDAGYQYDKRVCDHYPSIYMFLNHMNIHY